MRTKYDNIAGGGGVGMPALRINNEIKWYM